MILAAGLGTRLGEIGRDTPKALIDVGGATMLQHAARTLVNAGADRLIINAHHHADRIAAFVEATDLGAEAVLSIEAEEPLETGGGLLHAARLFRRDLPFFLYNVDILTDADLAGMFRFHVASGGIATLATGVRETSRRLLFDDAGLYGRVDDRRELRIHARLPGDGAVERSFAGIHVIAPGLLDRIEETGRFSILESYLRLAAEGFSIGTWSIEGAMWLDIGTPDRLAAARRLVAGKQDD